MEIFIAALISFIVAYFAFWATGYFLKPKIDGTLHIVKDNDPEIGDQQYMFLELDPTSVPKIKKGAQLYIEVDIVDKAAK